MTNRERILAVLEGRMPDRIPWIPRLRIWYEAHRRAGTLPPAYRRSSLREVERDVFGGTAARDGAVFRTEVEGVEVRVHRLDDMESLTEYVTPMGTVSTRQRGTPQSRAAGLADTQLEYLLKLREDFAVASYLVEHTRYVPTFEEYEQYDAQVGDGDKWAGSGWELPPTPPTDPDVRN